MLELATLLRTLYFLKHNCHNLVAKIAFFADHEFLGSSYDMTLGHYDSVVERIIGTGGYPDLMALQVNAANKLKNIPIQYKDNAECFHAIITLNKLILNMIESLAKSSLSQGTINLLVGIADQIEVENYKIGQRIKK